MKRDPFGIAHGCIGNVGTCREELGLFRLGQHREFKRDGRVTQGSACDDEDSGEEEAPAGWRWGTCG